MLTAPGYHPTPLSQSFFIENFHSNNYFAGGIKLLYHFNPALHLRLEGHGFVPIKEELPNQDFIPYKNARYISNYYLQGTAALVQHTPVGPVSLSLSYYEKPNTKLYLTLNFGYILFNRRGY